MINCSEALVFRMVKTNEVEAQERTRMSVQSVASGLVMGPFLCIRFLILGGLSDGRFVIDLLAALRSLAHAFPASAEFVRTRKH